MAKQEDEAPEFRDKNPNARKGIYANETGKQTIKRLGN